MWFGSPQVTLFSSGAADGRLVAALQQLVASPINLYRGWPTGVNLTAPPCQPLPTLLPST
jgi:hypothetical protein